MIAKIIRPRGNQTKIIAHRGASAEAPENTLSSISRALALCADFIEIDIHLAKDGTPVLSHDPTLQRITGKRGAPHIRNLTLQEIRKVDAGSHFNESFKGEPMPTLEEVLSLNWGNTGLMIEIKSARHQPEQLVDAVGEILKKAKNLPSKLMIGSFSPEIVTLLSERKAADAIEYDVIGIAEKLSMVRTFIEEGVTNLALWHRLITTDIMDILTGQHVEVWAFTVDRKKLAEQLISLNVNGIITNNPRNMLESRNFDLH